MGCFCVKLKVRPGEGEKQKNTRLDARVSTVFKESTYPRKSITSTLIDFRLLSLYFSFMRP